MDAEVAREIEHLLGECERERRHRWSLLFHRVKGLITASMARSLRAGIPGPRPFARAPSLHPLRERVGLAGGHAGGLRHLAQRGARPVRDDVGDLRSVFTAVAFVDMLDDLFAALVFDFEIDVLRAVTLG